MEYNEYLTLFNGGVYTVKVKFKEFSGSVRDETMSAQEITQLISTQTGEFFSELYFDGWPFQVIKYEINPLKRVVTIFAKQAAREQTN